MKWPEKILLSLWLREYYIPKPLGWEAYLKLHYFLQTHLFSTVSRPFPVGLYIYYGAKTEGTTNLLKK